MLHSMISWSQGKRTYLVAVALAVVTLVLWVTHNLTTTTAELVVMLGVSAYGVTYRLALEAHQQELVALLKDGAVLAGAVAARNPSAALSAAMVAVQEGETLVSEVRTEGAPPA